MRKVVGGGGLVDEGGGWASDEAMVSRADSAKVGMMQSYRGVKRCEIRQVLCDTQVGFTVRAQKLSTAVQLTNTLSWYSSFFRSSSERSQVGKSWKARLPRVPRTLLESLDEAVARTDLAVPCILSLAVPSGFCGRPRCLSIAYRFVPLAAY